MRRDEWRIGMEIVQNCLFGVIGINKEHVDLNASIFELESEFLCARAHELSLWRPDHEATSGRVEVYANEVLCVGDNLVEKSTPI